MAKRFAGVFFGLPVVVDTEQAEDKIRFVHPDGRVDEFEITDEGVTKCE